jgi:RNA polymerase sigma-B factor
MTSTDLKTTHARGRARGCGGEHAKRHEATLFRRYFETRSADLREELVRRFMPLARALARRYGRRSEPLEDLIQVANLALVKAVDGFDPRRGRPFTAYAVPTILGELRRHFRDHVWMLRLPRGLGELTMELERATDALTEELGRQPSAAQLADRLGTSIEEVLEGIEAGHARRTRSLDAPVRSDDESVSTLETVAESEPGYDRVEAQLAAEDAGLDEREWQVLRLRFADGLTQREIGQQLGVSQMQISRISRRALGKLLESVRGPFGDNGGGSPGAEIGSRSAVG